VKWCTPDRHITCLNIYDRGLIYTHHCSSKIV
jgi:hypothetical protein